ncbi:TPA: helix-turn-helix domain-containing protein [Clostridium sporogenes]
MRGNNHLLFNLIFSAVNCDEIAIEKILDFYDGYISKLSLRPMRDEYGNVYMVIDSELKGRIQEAVIKMVLDFQISVI